MDRIKNIQPFWFFAIPYSLIWVILCFVFQTSFREDILEQYFFGDQWVLGCGKHPMLSAWYLNFIRFLTGNSEISPYLATESLKFLLLYGIWRLSREFLKDERLAFLAVLASANYYFLNIGSQVYNHDVFVTFFWGISIPFFYRALDKNRTADWILTGLCLGLGFHAKYSIALPIVAMLLFMTVNPQARRYWKTCGPYITIGVAFLVFLPHLLWLIQNDFPTFQYASKISANRYFSNSSSNSSSGSWSVQYVYPTKFLFGALSGWILAIITLIPLTGRPWRMRLRPTLKTEPVDRFRAAFLIAMIGVPLAIHLLVACTGRYQPARFAMPLGLYVPLLILVLFQLRTDRKTLRRTLVLGLVIVVGIMLAWSSKNYYAVRHASRPSSNMFPSHALAEQVERIWTERYGQTPCPFVTDLTNSVGNRLAGVVNVYGKYHITVHDEVSTLLSSNEEMNRQGGIVLWNLKKNSRLTFADVLQRFPRAERLPDLNIPYSRPFNPAFEPEKIGVAIIPPHEEHNSNPSATDRSRP